MPCRLSRTLATARSLPSMTISTNDSNTKVPTQAKLDPGRRRNCVSSSDLRPRSSELGEGPRVLEPSHPSLFLFLSCSFWASRRSGWRFFLYQLEFLFRFRITFVVVYFYVRVFSTLLALHIPGFFPFRPRVAFSWIWAFGVLLLPLLSVGGWFSSLMTCSSFYYQAFKAEGP